MEDGHSSKEIVSRINQAKCVFQSKKNMLKSKNIDIKVKKNQLKVDV